MKIPKGWVDSSHLIRTPQLSRVLEKNNGETSR